MTKIIKQVGMPVFLLLMAFSLQVKALNEPMAESEFVKTFAGKTSEFVRQHLGEPVSITSKKNAGGTVEFWLYKDIVKIGNKGKTFQYTQIGIVNNYVETLGNTNRKPK